MVAMSTIEQQLKRLNCKIRFIGRAEMKELQHILIDGEMILQCLNGFYSGGGALLVATNKRLLLVDKKPWFLTIEDIRYDMITEIMYSARLLNATTSIHMVSKKLEFTSWKHDRLRMLTKFVQEEIMQMRSMAHQYAQTQQMQAATNLIHGTYLTRLLMRPRIGKFMLRGAR